MPFDHGHTCPDIDAALAQIKEGLADFVNDLVAELCPDINGPEFDDLVNTNAECLYLIVEPHVEDVRASNENMRLAAEAQISALEDE